MQVMFSFLSRDPTCKFMLATLFIVRILNICFHCVALFLSGQSWQCASLFLCKTGRNVSAVRQGMNRESQEVLCAADAYVEHVFLGGSPVSFAVSPF